MIPVKNIYYMLAYAYQILQTGRFKKLETENFENAQDMFAAVLLAGTKSLIQQGLKKEYVEQEEPLSSPKGKLNISSSIKTLSIQKQQLICLHDEFTENCRFNQVLKTALAMLLKSNLPAKRKKEIRSILGFFSNTETLNPKDILWNFHYTRLDSIYRMLMAVCELTIKGLLQSQNAGKTLSVEFIDEQRMSHLYEKFILEYFRQEHHELSASAAEISWQLDDDFSQLLPVMRSDITLEKDGRILIIDAKYYHQNLQTRFDHVTVHSNNLYQIFTYVKNKAAEVKPVGQTVSGMLLYAKTDSMQQPDQKYRMSGNSIEVKTLDLALPFAQIADQLDAITENTFA